MYQACHRMLYCSERLPGECRSRRGTSLRRSKADYLVPLSRETSSYSESNFTNAKLRSSALNSQRWSTPPPQSRIGYSQTNGYSPSSYLVLHCVPTCFMQARSHSQILRSSSLAAGGGGAAPVHTPINQIIPISRCAVSHQMNFFQPSACRSQSFPLRHGHRWLRVAVMGGRALITCHCVRDFLTLRIVCVLCRATWRSDLFRMARLQRPLSLSRTFALTAKASRVLPQGREGISFLEFSTSACTTSKRQPSLRSASEGRLMKLMENSYELTRPFIRTSAPRYIPRLEGDGLHRLRVHRMASHPPLAVLSSMSQAQHYLLSYWSHLG